MLVQAPESRFIIGDTLSICRDFGSNFRRRLLLLGLALAVTGCSRREREPAPSVPGGYETLELRYQGNNGTVTPAELAEDLGYLAPVRLHFVGSTVSGPASVHAVVTDDTDFGGAFNGAIIKLVAAKVPIVAVVGYYGVDDQRWSGFYVLEDSPIRTARDLPGMKISMNMLGAPGEQVLRQGQVEVACSATSTATARLKEVGCARSSRTMSCSASSPPAAT